MSLIELDVRDDYSRMVHAMDIQIEFSDTEQTRSAFNPTRISGEAGELADCDAVSTCPSDTDMIELFNDDCEVESFVCGTAAILKHLDPRLSLVDLQSSLSSLGYDPISVLCPTFLVCVGDVPQYAPREFNFGYACVTFATIEEATMFSFTINSQGLLHLDVDDECASMSDGDEPCISQNMFKLHVSTVSQIPTDDNPAISEATIRDYLSYYGDIVSLEWISGGDFEVTFSSEKSVQSILEDIVNNQHTFPPDIRFFVHPVDATATHATTVL